MSSIYYIEDIDSLRFGLSIFNEYNLNLLQPHFPGYPVFCFLGSIIYSFVGSLAYTFSIIGGVSSFIIIYFSSLLTNFKKYSIEYYFLIFLLFLNPMVWIMGNRYMPDLMGLSIFIVSFYFMTSSKVRDMYLGAFLFGILLGVRISYLPLLILPFGILLFKSGFKSNISLLASFLVGCFIWLLPMIWITGLENLIYLAQNQTFGHFTDFGGTILTENSWLDRIKYMIHTVWGDGLGGYWYGRSLFTLLFSGLMILFLYHSWHWIKVNISRNKKIKILIFSVIIYSLWALCFQNILYKSRHVMPIVYLLIILISFSFNYLNHNKHNYLKVVSIIFFLSLSVVTIKLVSQHQNPTAISKTREYLINIEQDTIVSNSLINYYLKSTGLNANFINTDESDYIELDTLYKQNHKIFMVGDYHSLFNNNVSIISDTIFYHNPYVNRMWSTINIYKIEI